MARTEKLCYDRPALLEAEARVIAVEGPEAAPLIELDRTIFYPEGGGQPCDLGSLGGSPVVAVTEEGERLLHRLGAPLGARFRAGIGDSVELRVDGARRLDYSQAHTGQHLLSALALKVAGAPTASVHYGSERCAIDFDLPALDEGQVREIEAEAEAVIAEDRSVRYHLCPPEDLSTFDLRKLPPSGEEAVRIVEIEGIDSTACCGLHLASTGALRVLQILGTEKYKGMTRLYFLAGGRAAADYRAVSRIAQAAARELGTSTAELAEAVGREARRRKELELALGAMERERAALEASTAPEAGQARADGLPPIALRRYEDRDPASLMATAKAFAQAGMASLLASLPGLTVQALSPDPRSALGSTLKAPLSETGGKGGGGPNSFRATFADRAGLERFLEVAKRELEGSFQPASGPSS